jgi:hypothetical protein
LLDPLQTVALPLMPPGWAGVGDTVTFRVWAVELPQLLLAMTVMAPLFAPAVALMLLLVELPVQPPGSDHV